MRYAQQTTVLSSAALRTLRFPRGDGQVSRDRDHAAHTVLASIALVAIELQREAGYWLRSRCDLYAAEHAVTRNTGVSYVPVNGDDKSMMFAQQKGSRKAGTAQLTFNPPIGRGWRLNRFRSGRSFPVATPHSPVVYFHWRNAHLRAQRETLQRLAERAPYLGRSSSVVRMSVVDNAPPATIEPCGQASDVSLRVPYPGLLARLKECYELAMDSTAGVRAHRPPTTMQTYGRCESQTPEPANVFGESFVFRRVEGPRVPLKASLHVTSAVRRALLSLADNSRLEILSGHKEDGSPSNQEHVAIVPLANVGYEYSDEDIKGVGIVLPARIRREERREVLVALSRFRELRLGQGRVWRVERVLAPPIWSLDWRRYSRESAAWATVTPMVFARHPRRSRPAEAMVAEACRQVGLPEPMFVEVRPHPPFANVPDARHCGTVMRTPFHRWDGTRASFSVTPSKLAAQASRGPSPRQAPCGWPCCHCPCSPCLFVGLPDYGWLRRESSTMRSTGRYGRSRQRSIPCGFCCNWTTAHCLPKDVRPWGSSSFGVPDWSLSAIGKRWRQVN